MSVITYPLSDTKRSSPFGFLIVLFLIVAFLIAFATINSSDHATDRHGSDAKRIRRCLDQNGPVQIFRADDVFYRVCQLDDGRFGIQAVRKISKTYDVYREITAFVKAHGTWEELIAYMNRLKAIPWGGPLP
ncbi:MAG: hypothetical protein JW908_00435 [Anaerolineales bacterium]|nr:hypothetical protein [Anaerolineales bacterium]